MLSGSLSRAGLINRGTVVVGRPSVWLRRLAERIVAHFGQGSRPRRFRLERFILNDSGFLKACEKQVFPRFSGQRFHPKMCPAAGPPRQWVLPPLCTSGELAQWLNLSPNELAWFADCRTQESKLPPGPLRHYRYRWQSKRDGSARLIESPKQRLKSIQRHLLRQILNHIPPHAAAHGFRAQHSIRTFVTPHVGQTIVVRLDLKDFFPSILRARIMAIFLTAGYPEVVAQLLTGLCTNSAPSEVIKSCPACTNAQQLRRIKLLYQRPHLPQGAPTSPALANLAAYRLDCRLAGLAEPADACYTRYADDLVFSGGEAFQRMSDRFYVAVCAIALEEGFEVNTRKTRIMRQSVSQRAGGVVLNQHVNIPRADYDRLKAIIHNCVTHGPSGQNRFGLVDFTAHLAGRIAHVEMLNRVRGQKLRAAFERIRW
jgi:RNA-directed DNA polymerase